MRIIATAIIGLAVSAHPTGTGTGTASPNTNPTVTVNQWRTPDGTEQVVHWTIPQEAIDTGAVVGFIVKRQVPYRKGGYIMLGEPAYEYIFEPDVRYVTYPPTDPPTRYVVVCVRDWATERLYPFRPAAK